MVTLVLENKIKTKQRKTSGLSFHCNLHYCDRLETKGRKVKDQINEIKEKKKRETV